MAWEPLKEAPSVEAMVQKASETVAGLEDAKKRLAVVLRQHAQAAVLDRPTRRPNVLIVAPTGVGKTYLVKALLEASGLPWIEVNATMFSGTGWVGRDLSSMFLDFNQRKWRSKDAKAGAHMELMERWGVVILDEFDKWRVDPKPTNTERQVGKELQSEMLKIAEGDIVAARSTDGGQPTMFNTRHILFIAMGAFQGIERIKPRESWLSIDSSDISTYGFMDELVGRFSAVIPLPPMTATAMLRILQEQVWPTWQQRASDDGLTLEAEEGALSDLVQMAMTKRVGARALEPEIDRMTWRAWAAAKPGDRIVFKPGITHGSEAQLVPA